MGWTSFNVGSGKSTADILRDEFTLNGKTMLGDIEIVGGVAYCIVNRKVQFCIATSEGDKFTTEIQKQGLVILVERSSGGIRYKDMHECMEPYYYDCPASILDQLSETDELGAIEWRRVCRENLAKAA